MKKLFVITALAAIINPVCANADYDIPDGYPLENASYFYYEDCVAENPDDRVDCVMEEETGITWAVAPFPTSKQTSRVWSGLAKAWSQIGTDKKLYIDDAGVREYIPGGPVAEEIYEYEFRKYNDFYNKIDSF